MGEMAEYMLNGDDCESCGEYIGPGPGYPRKCAGCGGRHHFHSSARQMGKTKQQRRADRRREKENDVRKQVEAWAEKSGADVKALQPWHIRISSSKLIVDIFPQRKKFHNVTTNVRGSYENEIDFLTQTFTQ